MSTISALKAILALDNSDYLDGLDSSQVAANGFGTTLSNMGGALVVGGLVAGAAAITAVGVAAWDAGTTMDDAMDSIATATGAVGPELEALQKDFENVFSSVPTDAATASTALGVLNSRLDVTGEALQGIAKPLLEATRLLGGDITTNAESFTRVMGDWNLPVENAAGSLDVLFVAAQKTGAPLDSLMERVVQYGAPMRNFGFSFEQSAALLAKFEAEGVNVETVMGGMRIAAGKFITQGKDMNTGLWETVDAIQNAGSETEGMGIAMKVFGAKAAGDMFDTIKSGKFDIDELVGAMQNADGTIMETAASTADWGEKWTTFKNKLTVALAPLGASMMNGMGQAMDQVVAIFERPDVQASLTTFVTMFAGFVTQIITYIPVLIDGFFQFITFLQNNQGIVIGVFAALGVAVVAWAVVTAAAAWSAMLPFLPVIAVLLLIGAAVYLLYQAWVTNFGGIQQITANALAWIQSAVQTVVDFFSAVWQNSSVQMVIQTVMSSIMAIFAAFKAAFNGDWYAFGENLRIVWDNAWQLIAAALTGLGQLIITGAITLMNNIKTVFTTTDWGAVGGAIIRGIANGISAGVGIITSAARSAASAALNAAKGFLGIKSPSTVFEMEVGYQMAAGVAAGWEGGLASLLEPAMSDLMPASAGTPTSTMPNSVSTTTGAGNDQAMIMEEIRRLLRDLPNEISRSFTTAAAKMPQGR